MAGTQTNERWQNLLAALERIQADEHETGRRRRIARNALTEARRGSESAGSTLAALTHASAGSTRLQLSGGAAARTAAEYEGWGNH